MCKELKRAILMWVKGSTLDFSTLFFTDLLKTGMIEWKPICVKALPLIHGKPGQVTLMNTEAALIQTFINFLKSHLFFYTCSY